MGSERNYYKLNLIMHLIFLKIAFIAYLLEENCLYTQSDIKPVSLIALTDTV